MTPLSTIPAPQIRPEDPSRDRRWPALDGVRGAFTIAVVVSHSICFGGLQQIFWQGRPMVGFSTIDRTVATYLWPFRDAALPGMDVFFVLSSFLITGILLDAKGRTHYFLAFYARRTLRIFPLYYLALSFLTGALYVASPDNGTVPHQVYLWTYTTNLLLANGWEQLPELFHHYWSLAVEEQFYVAWPLLVYLLPRRQFKWFCIVAIFGALAYRIAMYAAGSGDQVYVSTTARLDQLALGALLAVREREAGGLAAWHRLAHRTLPVCLLFIVGVAVLRDGLSEPDWLRGTVGHTVYAVFGASLVCIGVGPDSAVKRLFSTNCFRIYGKYSYAVYIFHQPVLIAIASLGLDMWHLARFPGFVLVGQVGGAAVAFALSMCAAWVSWHCVEAPMLSLRRYVDRPGASRVIE